jgi:hypothetical protein
MVVDRAAVLARLYVDGVQVDTEPITSIADVSFDNSYPVVLGNDGTLAYAVAHVDTAVDELKLWSSALTAGEVAAAAVPLCVAGQTPPASPATLLLHARLAEGFGGTTANAANVANGGVLRGVDLWQAGPTCPLPTASPSPVMTPSTSPSPTPASPSPSPSPTPAAPTQLSHVTFDAAGYAEGHPLSLVSLRCRLPPLCERSGPVGAARDLLTLCAWFEFASWFDAIAV